jgi:hypothetical protein
MAVLLVVFLLLFLRASAYNEEEEYNLDIPSYDKDDFFPQTSPPVLATRRPYFKPRGADPVRPSTTSTTTSTSTSTTTRSTTSPSAKLTTPDPYARNKKYFKTSKVKIFQN